MQHTPTSRVPPVGSLDSRRFEHLLASCTSLARFSGIWESRGPSRTACLAMHSGAVFVARAALRPCSTTLQLKPNVSTMLSKGGSFMWTARPTRLALTMARYSPIVSGHLVWLQSGKYLLLCEGLCIIGASTHVYDACVADVQTCQLSTVASGAFVSLWPSSLDPRNPRTSLPTSSSSQKSFRSTVWKGLPLSTPIPSVSSSTDHS
jgi:hypothetical protein